MRRSSEPQERAQFTVAELLARYGEPAPTTGRRHRRAADDDDSATDTPAVHTPAQPVFERNWASSREPTPRPPGEWTPAVGPPSADAGRAPVTPPVVASRAPRARTALPDGPVTDQLPRCDPAPVDRTPVDPTSWSSRRPVSYPVSAYPTSAQPPAGLGATTSAIAQSEENATVADEVQAQQSGSPLWEWAAMMSQVGMGVASGAALWLICKFLWQQIPWVALVVALAVITGLVWIVRRVRRTEDLQTTVIAVLVGLFVTVSPAALLLVGR